MYRKREKKHFFVQKVLPPLPSHPPTHPNGFHLPNKKLITSAIAQVCVFPTSLRDRSGKAGIWRNCCPRGNFRPSIPARYCCSGEHIGAADIDGVEPVTTFIVFNSCRFIVVVWPRFSVPLGGWVRGRGTMIRGK